MSSASQRDANHPRRERCHRMDEQQDLDARALAGEATLEGVAMANDFRIAERQVDLSTSCVQRNELTRTEIYQRGRGHQQPRLAFAAGILSAELNRVRFVFHRHVVA